MALSEAGRVLLESRYLLPGESASSMFRRVAAAVKPGRDEQFFRIMEDLLFLPNSPTLMNAGTPGGQLSACFVLPVVDSIPGIFMALAKMALIHKSGGGTGFSFSRIRPAGDMVGATPGVASGPLPFIHVFDEVTTALKQGGKRRGANMGVLASSHPDILPFIRVKKKGTSEISTSRWGSIVTFFDALARNGTYDLVNPRDGEIWDTLDAVLLWDESLCCSMAVRRPWSPFSRPDQ